ncbi:hypothetical protein BOTNAR_0211g00070 [Botryotinia narcissicola]|uniref:Uncharacterized protein n=1 Tax=Botryotinia narcissicola TaxID=278944 RepID=A0A4Z1I5V1_9HELO|nr:hypothetical protein BOTNAR_0211g00070 [Botryotinia narcissicola]
MPKKDRKTQASTRTLSRLHGSEFVKPPRLNANSTFKNSSCNSRRECCRKHLKQSCKLSQIIQAQRSTTVRTSEPIKSDDSYHQKGLRVQVHAGPFLLLKQNVRRAADSHMQESPSKRILIADLVDVNTVEVEQAR